MPILKFTKKLLLLLAICFSMTAASAADKKPKCQVTGKLLITEYPQLKNTSVELVEAKIRSPEIIDSVVKDLSNNYEILISKQELLEVLTIETKPSLGIFYIYFRHSNSQLATQVVKSLMKNYTRVNLLKDKKQVKVLQNIVSEQIQRKKQELLLAGQEVLKLNQETQNITKEKQEQIIIAEKKLEKIGSEMTNLMRRWSELSMVEKNQKNNTMRNFNHVDLSC